MRTEKKRNNVMRKCNVKAVKGYHTYIRKDCIHSAAEFDRICTVTTSISPLFLNGKTSDVSIDAFIERLFAYEQLRGSTRLLETLQVLLPVDYPASQYLTLAKAIASQQFSDEEGTLPFFVRLGKHGTSTYLYLFFTERHYYPEGRTITILRDSDFWRDSVTGRRCKEGADNAVLVGTKGDFLRKEVIYFSTKTRFFRIDDMTFKGLLYNLRIILVECFRNFCEETVLFGRACYDGVTSFALKRRYRIYNKMILHCERAVTDILHAYHVAGFTNAEQVLLARIPEWQSLLMADKGSYTMTTHTFRFFLNPRSRIPTFKANVDLAERRFMETLENFTKELLKTPELQAVYSL